MPATTHPTPPSPRRRRWTIRLVAAAVAVALVAGFAAQNYGLVEVRIAVWRTDLRLAWALLAALGLGLVAGLGLSRFRP